MTAYWTKDALTSFLDRELGDANAKQLEAALDAEPELAARLQALNFDRTELKDTFDALLDEAPAFRPVQIPSGPVDTPAEQVSTQSNVLRFYRKRPVQALAFAASMVAAVYLGTQLAPNSGLGRDLAGQNDWLSMAAAYHALYDVETLAVVDNDGARISGELARVASQVGRALPMDALKQAEGLTLKRAQILAFEGRALVQVAYVTPAGEPVALCIFNIGTESAAVVELTRMHNMPAAKWTHGGHAFLLIGGTDPVLIEAAAEHFSTEL